MIGDLGHHHSVIDVVQLHQVQHWELARSRDDSDLLFFSSSNSHVQYRVIQLSHGAQGLYSEMSQGEIKLHNHDLHDFSSNRSGGAHCLWLTKNPKKKFLYNLVQKIISFHYHS